MTIESLSALAGLAVSMTWTPGPNNMMLAASGANFGWRRTTAHALGVSIGFPVMLFLVAIGLGRLFAAEPMIAETLSWIGFAIVLWFAWKIATAVQARAAGRAPRPLSFLQACAFQWVNPKAWTFAIWVTASYATGATSALTAALVFLISGLASSFAWSVFGADARALTLKRLPPPRRGPEIARISHLVISAATLPSRITSHARTAMSPARRDHRRHLPRPKSNQLRLPQNRWIRVQASSSAASEVA